MTTTLVDHDPHEFLRRGFDPAEYSPDELAAYGVSWSDTGEPVYTAFNHDGTEAYRQTRTVRKGRKIWMTQAGNDTVGGFIGPRRPDAPLLITEGPGDGLAASLAGAFDVYAIRGAAAAAKAADELPEELVRGRDVILAGDLDPQGEKFNAVLAERLAPIAGSVRAVRYDLWDEQAPAKFDLTDLSDVAHKRGENFADVLAAALGEPKAVEFRANDEDLAMIPASESDDRRTAMDFSRLFDGDQYRARKYTWAAVEGVKNDLLAAARMAPGQTDDHGRGWEKICADAALRLVRLGLAPWAPVELDHARDVYMTHAPTDAEWTMEAVTAKWESQLQAAQYKLGGAVFPPDDVASREAEIERLKDRELTRLEAKVRAEKEFSERKAEEARPFNFLTVKQGLALPPMPADRIDGLIPWEASTLIVGERKAGKSTLSLNLSNSLITGEDALGRFKVNPIATDATVVYMNYELNARQMTRWADDHGMSDHDRWIQLALAGEPNPFASTRDRQRLAGALRDLNVETLIVDPFASAFFGSSENDNTEVRRFLDDLSRFTTECGAKDLILVAHASAKKSGDPTARGAGALEDWADVVINLTKGEAIDAPRSLSAFGRDILVPKERLDHCPETRRMTMSGTTEADVRSSLDAAKVEARIEAVLAVLEDHPQGLSVTQVTQRLGLDKDHPETADTRYAEYVGLDGWRGGRNGVSEALTLAASRDLVHRKTNRGPYFPGAPMSV